MTSTHLEQDQASNRVYSDFYEVTHNDRRVPVYYSRVGAFVILKLENNGNQLVIENKAPIERVEVIPKLSGSYQIESSTIVIDEIKEGKHFIKIDRNYVYPLMVLAYQPEEKLKGTHVFDSGVHRVGEISLTTGDHLILNQGSIVYGNVVAEDASNVRISGTGILKGTEIPMDEKAGVFISSSTDVSISGVTILDPAKAGIVLNGSSQIKIENVNLIGNRELRMNDDGINIVSSKQIAITKVLTNTRNNAISLRHEGDQEGFNQDIQVSSSWFWKGDYGNGIDIRYDSNNGQLQDVVIKDIDIIHCEGGSAINMKAKNATFNNIQLERIQVMDASFMLLDVQVSESTKLKNVILKDISYSGIKHAYSDIVIESNHDQLKMINIQYQGIDVQKPEDLHLRRYSPELFSMKQSL